MRAGPRCRSQGRRALQRRPAAISALSAAFVGAALILPVTALPASAGSLPGPAGPCCTAEIVVGLVPGTSAQASVHAASVAGQTPTELPANRYLLRVRGAAVATTLSALRAQGQVAYAEVAKPIHAAATPGDPCYVSGCGSASSRTVIAPVEHTDGTFGPPTKVAATQNDLAAVHAPGAWSVTTGSPAVKVGVLDGPVEVGNPADSPPTNPDLAGKVTVRQDVCLAAGNSVCSDARAADPTAGADVNLGHATHVTGTVAAATDNQMGVASLGWNTTVNTYQVLDVTGSGTTADLATGIYDAVADGVRVINMSVAGPTCTDDPSGCGPDPDTQAAVGYAEAHNVVVVAAAGNAGETDPTYPAAYPGVLSAAATDDSATVQSFSEHGSAANIAAPGLDVLSTWDDGSYALLSGTSMAAPHVAAAAALMIAANPALSGQQVTAILEGTAGPTTGPSISGGMLDAAGAVQAARAGNVPSPQGYELAGSDGSLYPFGDAVSFGGVSHLAKPVVGAAAILDRQGEWLVASDGGIFSFGDAKFLGSEGGKPLAKPIVGMAATPDGGGYWLVASDGGIFSFGDAKFLGSEGGVPLAKPIVGMAASPDGGGYWLVANDGGIFTFGTAKFYGSEGGKPLARPMVGMVGTGSGGYWTVASDGGIFTFGPGADYHGSTGGQNLPGPIVAITQP